MEDSPLTTPVEHRSPGFFRNPEFPFVLLRLLIYLVLAEAFTYEFIWISNALGLNGNSPYSLRNLMSSECVRLAGVFAAAWVMSRLEARGFGDYGLPFRSGSLSGVPLHSAKAARFWQGAVFGLVEISVVLGTLAALGYYHFGSVELHGLGFFKWLAFWLIFFLVVGLFEELAFRGYAQFALTQAFGFWPAAIVTSVIFGVVHLTNPGESWTGIAGVVFTGFFWCFTLKRTGNLWFAVGMHMAFDFAETFLYSVPDSGTIFPGHLSSATIAGPVWLVGGSAGPEASVLDFAVLLVFFFVFHFLYPTKRAAEK
jgi:membrane protease YdiL (CAAX protease family)